MKKDMLIFQVVFVEKNKIVSTFDKTTNDLLNHVDQVHQEDEE